MTWMRWSGSSAHQASVSHAIAFRHLRMTAREVKQEMKTRPEVLPAKRVLRSPCRFALTGPWLEAAYVSTCQLRSAR